MLSSNSFPMKPCEPSARLSTSRHHISCCVMRALANCLVPSIIANANRTSSMSGKSSLTVSRSLWDLWHHSAKACMSVRLFVTSCAVTSSAAQRSGAAANKERYQIDAMKSFAAISYPGVVSNTRCCYHAKHEYPSGAMAEQRTKN